MYGSLKVEHLEEAPRKGDWRKSIFGALVVVAMVTVGVFFISTPNAPRRTLDQLEPVDEAAFKNKIFTGEDCRCVSECSKTLNQNGFHVCAVDNLKCKGIDYATSRQTLGTKFNEYFDAEGTRRAAALDIPTATDNEEDTYCFNDADGNGLFESDERIYYGKVLGGSALRNPLMIGTDTARSENAVNKGQYVDATGAWIDIPTGLTDLNLYAPACVAVCEYVYGRYDCWSFPCNNGGFCLDGVDTYTCHCAFGFQGEQCENDIDECAFETKDFDDDGMNVNQGDTWAVCAEHATCTNSFGKYSCECDPGWEGDGYQISNRLSYSVPSWLERPKNPQKGYIPGCKDIDHCLTHPCYNGATCENIVGEPNTINEGGIEYGYNCQCPIGLTYAPAWKGHDCEQNVDECEMQIDDCDPKATCKDTPGSFQCLCNNHWTAVEPYTGYTKQGRATNTQSGCFDIVDCDTKPCKNGGTCIEGLPGCEQMRDDGTFFAVDCYSCNCVTGYTGFNCEVDENECGEEAPDGKTETPLDICDPNAFCTNTPGSFECSCNAGWTGDGIGCVDADDCEFSPCAHGGTCYDCGTLCFSCDCVPGWRGATCGTDWDECRMGIHSCNNDATCINVPGSYNCMCDSGFEGDGFGQGQTWIAPSGGNPGYWEGCKDIDDCDPAKYNGRKNGPCLYGICQDTGANEFHCECEPGWTDKNCDLNRNECNIATGDNPCHRFATCTDTPGSYSCRCNIGFTGNGITDCTDISDCVGQCVNGFCVDLGVNDYRCECDRGYKDKKCDFNINECTDFTHECAPHATCNDVDGSYTCACNYGFQGDGVEFCKDIDDCASNPCKHGDCTDQGQASYTCDCNVPGWTDFNCDFDINECFMGTHECHVDARCVNVPGGYECRCLSGWEGDGYTCTDMDDCDPDPCDPVHGSCIDGGPNKWICECDYGWTGATCAFDLDDCAAGTHECDSNAACLNQDQGMHQCTCNYPVGENGGGYYDPNIPVGKKPGTLCVACTVCGPGYAARGECKYEDRSCDNVNECADPPGPNNDDNNCDENAVCTDTTGSFLCECAAGYWGIGVVIGDAVGCTKCTTCGQGFHEDQPCTATTDRTCKVNVRDGVYLLETEAGLDVKSCLIFGPDEVYPSRINYCDGGDGCTTGRESRCGLPHEDPVPAEALWYFDNLGDGANKKLVTPLEIVDPNTRYGDLYTIAHAGPKDSRQCLFFGGKRGGDLYPQLANCKDAGDGPCLWQNPEENVRNCGTDLPDAKFRSEGQAAVWRLVPLKINDNKYLIQSAADFNINKANDPDDPAKWQCLIFDRNGMSTNPSRYNWGNGARMCGAGDWEGEGQKVALLNNKQAVWILTYMSKDKLYGRQPAVEE